MIISYVRSPFKNKYWERKASNGLSTFVDCKSDFWTGGTHPYLFKNPISVTKRNK